MTGIYFDAVTSDWAVELEAAGGVVGYAPNASEAAAMLDDEIARWERFHATQAAHLAAMMPAVVEAPELATASENAAPAALVVASVSSARCPFYRSIRRAYAIARDLGLDTKADDAMRAAFGRCLGRTIKSRDELNGGDWMLLGDAMKARRLAW
jgi:Tfp pilus assembly protein PilE